MTFAREIDAGLERGLVGALLVESAISGPHADDAVTVVESTPDAENPVNRLTPKLSAWSANHLTRLLIDTI